MVYVFREIDLSLRDYIVGSGIENHWLWSVLTVLILCAMSHPSPHMIAMFTALVYVSQESWAQFYDSWQLGTDKGQRDYCVFFMPMLFFVIYYVNGIMMLFLELKFADLIEEFRVQKGTRVVNDTEKMKKLFKNVTGNLLITMPLLCCCAWRLNVRGIFNIHFDQQLPSPMEMFVHMLCFIFIFNETVFFYAHWFMHANKWVYKNIHKIHHEFTAPCSLAAIYCHPVEFAIADFLPFAIGGLVMDTHPFTFILFTIGAVTGTQNHHSGYQFPYGAWDHQPFMHDAHHMKFNGNYGAGPFFDWLHGTAIPTLKDKEGEEYYAAALNRRVLERSPSKESSDSTVASESDQSEKAISPKKEMETTPLDDWVVARYFRHYFPRRYWFITRCYSKRVVQATAA